jgi:hypothetical protein
MKPILLVLLTLTACVKLSAQTPGPKDTAIDLVRIDTADLYGFSGKYPIKTGGGPSGQHKYLDALRDAQGKPITYERKGSCCEYPSKNGLMGYAMVDRYEVTYYDAANKKQKTLLFISMYDLDKPMAVKGFTLQGF